MTMMIDQQPSLRVFDRELIEEGSYWMQKLSAVPPTRDLTPDYARPAVFAPEQDSLALHLPDELSQALSNLTRQGDFLLYATLVAAVNICLFRHTNEATVVVGSPARRRD